MGDAPSSCYAGIRHSCAEQPFDARQDGRLSWYIAAGLWRYARARVAGDSDELRKMLARGLSMLQLGIA